MPEFVSTKRYRSLTLIASNSSQRFSGAAYVELEGELAGAVWCSIGGFGVGETDWDEAEMANMEKLQTKHA